MPSADSHHRWVSLPEASRLLSIPETTLRRLIREGTIVAELVPRAEGDPRTVYRVRIDQPPDDPPPSADSEGEHPLLSADLIRAAVEPYVAMNERLAELYAGAMADNRQLAERVGRAEADAGRLQAELDRERRPWWRKLWES